MYLASEDNCAELRSEDERREGKVQCRYPSKARNVGEGGRGRAVGKVKEGATVIWLVCMYIALGRCYLLGTCMCT